MFAVWILDRSKLLQPLQLVFLDAIVQAPLKYITETKIL
jgi:hypothetical protein